MPAILSPAAQGILAAASQGLQASGPSLMPVGFGQIMGGMGQAGMGAYRQAQNDQMRMALAGLEFQKFSQNKELQDIQLQMAKRKMEMQNALLGLGSGGDNTSVLASAVSQTSFAEKLKDPNFVVRLKIAGAGDFTKMHEILTEPQRMELKAKLDAQYGAPVDVQIGGGRTRQVFGKEKTDLLSGGALTTPPATPTNYPRETPGQRDQASAKRLQVLYAEAEGQQKTKGRVDPELKREIEAEEKRRMVPKDKQRQFGLDLVPPGVKPSAADVKASEEEVRRQAALKEDQPKAKLRLESARTKARVVSDKVEEALLKVDEMSTGFMGGSSKNIPGSPAYNLQKTIDTIQALLGFKELQEMREASKSGGALGQVAVRELEMLQSTFASLDIGQGKEQLMRNLRKAQGHMNKWKAAVEGSYRELYGSGDVSEPREDTPKEAAKVRRYNPKTGKIE